MDDRFRNRMGMFETALGVLKSPNNQAVWQNGPPIFAKKVAQAQAAVDDLHQLLQQQQREITGTTKQKRHEKDEAAEQTDVLASSMLVYFQDRNDQVNAAKVNHSLSYWKRSVDESLLGRAREINQLATEVIAANEQEAAEYGITPEVLGRHLQEVEDFAALLTAPQQEIAKRRALTGELGNRFNEVEACFENIDRLSKQFRHTVDGREFIEAYRASRIVRDLGRRPSSVDVAADAAQDDIAPASNAG